MDAGDRQPAADHDEDVQPHGHGADSGLAPERVHRQLESSLERLGVDAVDLYLAHEPDPATPFAETLGAFEEQLGAGRSGPGA